MTDKTKNIYQRLAAVRSEVTAVHRREVDRQNQKFAGFAKYISHDDVTAALQKAYLLHGIDREVSVISATRGDQVLTAIVEVSWVNVDDPTDRKTVRAVGESLIAGGKAISDKQAGIAISYACKMAEVKNLCLTGDDTPDPETASPGKVQVRPTAVPDDLVGELQSLELAFVDGDGATVDAARRRMREIAPRLPQATIDAFLELLRDAKERLSNG